MRLYPKFHRFDKQTGLIEELEFAAPHFPHGEAGLDKIEALTLINDWNRLSALHIEGRFVYWV